MSELTVSIKQLAEKASEAESAMRRASWALSCFNGKALWRDSAGNYHSVRSHVRIERMYINSLGEPPTKEPR